jgi:hypothetical protein
MSTNKARTSSKVVSLLVAGLILAAGIWAVLTAGPRPRGLEHSEKTHASEATSASPAAVHRDAIAPDASLAAADLKHLESFGLSKFRVDGGKVAESGPAFMEKLERSYLDRGYTKLEQPLDLDNSERSGKLKLERSFWTSVMPGFAMLSAVGPNATPDLKLEAKPGDVFLTIVSNGTASSSDWATYRLGRFATTTRKDDVSVNEFPGEDPPFVPRPEGSSRLFGTTGLATGENRSIAIYKVRESVERMSEWYYQAMIPNWRFDDLSTKQASVIGDRILCFTQQNRFCLIWIAKNPDEDTTTVVVSVRHS